MTADKRRAKTSDSNIVRYPSGTYYYRSGAKEISLKTNDFRKAKKAKDSLLLKGTDVLSSSTRIKIKDLEPDYLKHRADEYAQGKIRMATLSEATFNFKKITKYYGNVSVAKMDSLIWDHGRDKIVGNQIVNIRNTMAHFMKWCVRRRYRATVPILDVGQITRRKRRILKPEEIKAILLHSSGSLRVFVMHALVLGMRRSEIMTLEWSQINLNDKVIFLPGKKTKTKKDRFITIPDSICSVLASRHKKQANAGIKPIWVFPRLSNYQIQASISGLRTAWRTCLKKAFSISPGDNVPDITWHDLRATCEYYAHKRTDLSATQLEKFFGSNVGVQRTIYVHGDAEFVRGVENSINLPATVEIDVGKSRGEEKQ